MTKCALQRLILQDNPLWKMSDRYKFMIKSWGFALFLLRDLVVLDKEEFRLTLKPSTYFKTETKSLKIVNTRFFSFYVILSNWPFMYVCIFVPTWHVRRLGCINGGRRLKKTVTPHNSFIFLLYSGNSSHDEVLRVNLNLLC